VPLSRRNNWLSLWQRSAGDRPERSSTLLDYFTTLAMLLLGMIVGAIVVSVAQFLGFSGWIVGPIFCGLVLAFIYVNNRIMGFGMRHVISFLAKLEDTKLFDSDKNEIEENFSKRMDYYGFLVGSVVGTLASLLFAPSIVFDWLPF
jgi:hypothetical protein